MSRDTQLHSCPFPAILTGLRRYLIKKSHNGEIHTRESVGGNANKKNAPIFSQLPAPRPLSAQSLSPFLYGHMSTPARSRVYFPAGISSCPISCPLRAQRNE
jgi:hypothetical protein